MASAVTLLPSHLAMGLKRCTSVCVCVCVCVSVSVVLSVQVTSCFCSVLQCDKEAKPRQAAALALKEMITGLGSEGLKVRTAFHFSLVQGLRCVVFVLLAIILHVHYTTRWARPIFKSKVPVQLLLLLYTSATSMGYFRLPKQTQWSCLATLI